MLDSLDEHSRFNLVISRCPRLERLQRYVEDNLERRLTLLEAAEVAGLERTYFSKYFRDSIGINYSEWDRGFRVESAKPLLRFEKLTVLEIAHRVGYKDTTTFGRSFKRSEGMTPSEYRARYWSGYARRTHSPVPQY